MEPAVQPDEPPKEKLGDAIFLFGILGFCVSCVAYPHEMLVRRLGSMGTRYSSRWAAVVGVTCVPWLAAFVVRPVHGSAWIPLHAALLLIVAAAHAMKRRLRYRNVNHSLYIGDPRLGGAGGRWGETAAGLVIAAVLFALSPTLGVLHLAATVCSRAQIDQLRNRDRRQLVKMRDAQLEGQYLADRMRNGD